MVISPGRIEYSAKVAKGNGAFNSCNMNKQVSLFSFWLDVFLKKK